MADNDPSPSFDTLATRIKEAKGEEEPAAAEEGLPRSKMALAWRLSIELVAGVAVGTTLGYFLDKWTNLSPLFLLLGLMLGSAAGFRNMLRAVRDV